MLEKLSINDFLTRILPGGFLIGILLFVQSTRLESIHLNGDLDFFYSFIFFCSAFIVGEVLQTIAHSLEFVIDVFTKGYRPSEIFLLKNNPIIKDEAKRNEIINSFELNEKALSNLNFEYKNLKVVDHDTTPVKLSQSLFRQIYTQYDNEDSIKQSNLNYLFIRVIAIEFLIISFIFVFYDLLYFLVCFIIFIILLRRARGVAKGLVRKVSDKYLSNLYKFNLGN